MIEHARHERFRLLGGNVVIEQLKVQPQPVPLRREANRRDNRQTISSVPAIVDGRLASGPPTATHRRLQHKTAFVGENDGFTAFSGFFLYGANPPPPKWLSPVRLVRELCVRAFGNCSPSASGFARLERDGNKLETSCESPLQYVPMSTSSFCNRKLSGLCLTDAPTFDVACLKVSLADRVSAWDRGLLLRLFCRHRAIAPPNCRKSQPFWQPRGFHRRLSAELLLALDAAGVPLLFLLVSYIILSANTGSFLYFFKGQ